MQTQTIEIDSSRYAQCIANSKKIHWEIERDVIRGRRFEMDDKFLPDGLSMVDRLDFLTGDEKRFLSQIQGRTYANIFGLVERFINAKMLELSREYWLGNQTALEALVGFCDQELKHQALFRRVEALAGAQMPPGYRFEIDPDDVARAVLGKRSWAVLALTLHIELFTQVHYRNSINPDPALSALFKDVFLFHWKEESQHAILDELEWKRLDRTMTDAERAAAVDDFIDLVIAVDGILQAQAAADAAYFAAACGRVLDAATQARVRGGVLAAYRWQYILSGAAHPHFQEVLGGMVSAAQLGRIEAALATLA